MENNRNKTQKIAGILSFKIGVGLNYLPIPEETIPQLVHYISLFEGVLEGEKNLSQGIINNLDNLLSSMDPNKILIANHYNFMTTKESFRTIKNVYPLAKGKEINGSVEVDLDYDEVKVLLKDFFEKSQEVLEKYLPKEVGGKR